MDSRSSWRPDPILKEKNQIRKIKIRNIYELQHSASSRKKLVVITRMLLDIQKEKNLCDLGM